MNRRSFFGVLAAGLAAAADPERLVWEPGRKLISIPRPPIQQQFDPKWCLMVAAVDPERCTYYYEVSTD